MRAHILPGAGQEADDALSSSASAGSNRSSRAVQNSYTLIIKSCSRQGLIHGPFTLQLQTHLSIGVSLAGMSGDNWSHALTTFSRAEFFPRISHTFLRECALELL